MVNSICSDITFLRLPFEFSLPINGTLSYKQGHIRASTFHCHFPDHQSQYHHCRFGHLHFSVSLLLSRQLLSLKESVLPLSLSTRAAAFRQRHAIHALHLHFGMSTFGTCDLFQMAVWKLARLKCWLLRHGGKEDKSMWGQIGCLC